MKQIIAIIRCCVPLLLGCVLLLSSCKKEPKYPGYTETPSGLFYKLQAIGDGTRKPRQGDYIDVRITYKTAQDSVFLDSGYDDELNRLIIPFHLPSFRGSFEEYIPEMNEGDSISCIISADSVFAKFLGVPLPVFLKQGSLLHIDVKLKKILDAAGFQQAQVKRQELLDDMDIEEQRKLTIYLQENNIATSPIEDGLYYLPLIEGNGMTVETGKAVYINYKGYFMNGKLFDSNNGRMPLDFIYGDQDQVIKGIEMGLKYMKEGSKAKFIIPSRLAFGEKGSSAKIVPPYTTVIYEIELVKVK